MKKELHAKIREAQLSLREDILALKNVLLELKTLQGAANELKQVIEFNENTRSVVGTAKRIKLVKDDFEHLCSSLLVQNDPAVFIVNKELQSSLMIPEFVSNAPEARHLIDSLGAINFRAYYPEGPSNSLWRVPSEPKASLEIARVVEGEQYNRDRSSGGLQYRS